jgi:uncharacterized protein (DUF488 family)
MTLVTIGVCGFTEDSFFAALRNARVDTFCDVRSRRGVRGVEYAFANSARLQQRLAELGIRYVHCPEVAPSPALRQRQYAMDKASGTTQRQRTTLSARFVAGYREECLRRFDSHDFLSQLGAEANVVALCCVEGEPAACHRSLLTDRLQQDVGARVIHLKPPGPGSHRQAGNTSLSAGPGDFGSPTVPPKRKVRHTARLESPPHTRSGGHTTPCRIRRARE